MFALLRHRNYALLWVGGLISLTGDWMLIVALPIAIYRQTGSALATSLMVMAGSGPRLIFGSLAGVFVDRWDRKRTLVIANLLLTFIVLAMAIASAQAGLWALFPLQFLRSSVAQFLLPAENALLPRLVGEEQITRANSMAALNINLSRLLGPAAAGVVVGLTGLAGIAVSDAASYLLASGLIAWITVPAIAERRATADAAVAVGAWRAVLDEWLSGLQFVRRGLLLSRLLLVLAITSVGEGVMSVLFVVFVSTVLHGGTRELGWFVGAQAVGGICGGILLGSTGGAVGLSRLIGYGALLLGLIDLVVFNYPAFIPGIGLGLALFVVVGVPAVACVTGVTTLVQTTTPDRYRGRVFGAAAMTSALLMLIGAAIAGVAAGHIGVVRLLNVDGAGYVLAGLLALVLLRSSEAPGMAAQADSELGAEELLPNR